MITVRIRAASANFRKSFARSYAETYPVAPPATVYGLLLSLVGERSRAAHEGVRLAFAYRRIPRVAETLHKLSRYKYGVASKQSKLGNQPDYVETVCDLDFLCWVDSSEESGEPSLEQRVARALAEPASVSRYGVLSIGRSDDLVDEVSIEKISSSEHRYRMAARDEGSLELPVWVDHVGSKATIWRRFELDRQPVELGKYPEAHDFVDITSDR